MTARRRRSRIAARRKQAAGASVPAAAAPCPAGAPVVPASRPSGVNWKRVVAVEPAEVARTEFFAARGLPDDAAAAGTDHLLAVADGAWRAMMDHARSAPVEVGGLLVGEVFCDEAGRLLVDAAVAIPALGAVQQAAYFRLNEAAWEHISRERAALHPDLLTVGWYHTHPGLGVFFSGTDRASQRAFFNRPWNMGLVIDPQRDEVALFRGEESERLSPAHLVVYDGAAANELLGDADGQVLDRGRGEYGHDGRGRGWRGYGGSDHGSPRWSGREHGGRDSSRPNSAIPGVGARFIAPASSPGPSSDSSAASTPATVAPVPSPALHAAPPPADTRRGDATATSARPLASDRGPTSRPIPSGMPWASLAVLAGAVFSFAMVVRSGMRSRRAHR